MKTKTLGILSLGAISLLLASCGSSVKTNLPADKNSAIVDIGTSTNPFNNKEEYYDKINTGDTIQAKALDMFLLQTAEQKMAADNTWLTEEQISAKVEKAMVEEVSSGTYDTDYKFSEKKYVASLKKNLYSVTCSAGTNEDYVITPESGFADIFKCDYSDYIEKSLKPTIIKNRLVADYIYNESYTSIGSTNARDVKIVAIADRSDKPGMARKLINYFIENYIDTENPLDGHGDLDVLARLWKGEGSILSTDGTTAEKLKELGIGNLYDKIEDEVKKINLSDPDNTDLTLESQYTGSYTYSLEKGIELAKNSLKKQDLITEGYYLKSTGLTALPEDLKNRIFSSNYNTDPASTTRDVTTTMKNGKRYLTSPTSEQGDKDNMIYYDSASKTYYLVEIRDVINNASLKRVDTDSEEVKASKKARALEVAYEMSTTSSYVKNSTVHFLKEADISWHDEDFYNYILTNYPDVFEDED